MASAPDCKLALSEFRGKSVILAFYPADFSPGLLGFVGFAAGYLSMLGTEFVAALVLPSIAHSANA